MNITPWRNKSVQRRSDDPFEFSLNRLRDGIEEIFDHFVSASPLELWPGKTVPRLDMEETDKDITLRVDLPGVDPKDVDIRVEGNRLTLRGEKKRDNEEKRADYHLIEREYGSFQRSVQLPTTADTGKVDATYKNGVLCVTIGKKPDALARKVTVRQA